MRGLNDQIRRIVGRSWPDAPVKPWSEAHRCAIAATHDIDFLPTTVVGTAERLVKNLVIACIVFRDWRLAASIAAAAARGLAGGRAALDCLPAMLRRERELGIDSTCNVLARKEHRRDGNYQLEAPKTQRYLERLAAAGVEIGLHGSYSSLDSPGRLVEEYRRLAQIGHRAVGGRQHWLRCPDDRLFGELRDAGAWYDCTVGYPWHLGFRTGACFAYPPYDFDTEAPYPLLELPMVLMDVAVYHSDRAAANWRTNCERVLNAVGSFGWGGVSILWHDTALHGAQLPPRIGDLFWTLKREDEKWLSAKKLVEQIWHRYAAVGLVPARRPEPTAAASRTACSC
jgi:peptidoglycan/xylan/chitin deacetylase (PgdA/CDA1 family)